MKLKKIYILCIALLIVLFCNREIINNIFVDKGIFNNFKKEIKIEKVLQEYNGLITAYGPDCKGCSGYTASGYNVKNNIYYNDKEYGTVRVLASDKSIPFGSIVRIENNDNNILGIVLDRGSAIGFNKKAFFDLLEKSEKDTESFGAQHATFKILRFGY